MERQSVNPETVTTVSVTSPTREALAEYRDDRGHRSMNSAVIELLDNAES